MKRIVWLTDIHLNFVPRRMAERFLDTVAAARPDAVLIGGDIGESHDVCEYLARIDAALAVPVYFVLGNHDFYHGSIAETRQRVARWCERHSRLRYLTLEGACELAPGVGLVGHDGWADGRLGEFLRSLVAMNDYKLIDELAGLDKLERWEVLKRLGDEAAAHFRRVLPAVLEEHRDVIVLTHVPPFREACWHQGQLSNDQWLPHFTCQAAGEVLLEQARLHPQARLTVLCGHTHGSGQSQPALNLQVITAGAAYGSPAIAQVFEFDERTSRAPRP